MNTTPTSRRTTGLAALASAVLLLQSLVWLLLPGLNPYADPELAQVRALLPLSAHAALLATLALVGTICAGIGALRPTNAGAGQVVRRVAPVLTLGLFAATTSMSGLSFAGYAVGMTLPVAAIIAGVVAAVRIPRARLPLGLTLLAGVSLIVVFRDLIWTTLGRNLVAFGQQAGTIWALLLTLGVIALWVTLTVTALRQGRWTAGATQWLVRHRRVVTVLAAIGPLPYAIVRLTWLTPWPIGLADGADEAITAWGLMLSLGAWMGTILTLGLILPWGERVPRWLPRVGGRPVPPAAAIVPGGIVAGLLCLAAVPWTLTFLQAPTSGFAPYFFILPVGYWGVMLALAVWAYAGHRSQQPVSAVPPGQPGQPGIASADPADTMVR